MKALFIHEKNDSEIEKLKTAFNKKSISVELVEIGKIGLLTEGKETSLILDSLSLENIDSCFLSVGVEFTQFVEPLLDEFSQKGIYCQVKPDSYSMLSSKAFQLTTLTSHGIKTPNTTIFGSSYFINASLKEFRFPLILQVFDGYKKIQDVLVESEKSLLSIVKSIKSDFDVLLLQEFFNKDLDVSAVIGENVFTVRRPWIKEKLEYAKKGSSRTLSEKEQKNVINACNAIGIEIATVKSIDGNIVSLKPSIDFSFFQEIIGKNLYETTAEFYLSKFKKE
ncbi:hypothetical protein KKG83_01160 [Candidatus Micrarchaeota archaeon]|nr:hypothetical protein [Candidatus Micrarchaeota archaeon]MBU2476058.1 hypothetical protein [Candidatus Micrarchaeota archaeon]